MLLMKNYLSNGINYTKHSETKNQPTAPLPFFVIRLTKAIKRTVHSFKIELQLLAGQTVRFNAMKNILILTNICAKGLLDCLVKYEVMKRLY